MEKKEKLSAKITYRESPNFINTDEFIDCFNRGCEVEFSYNGKDYGMGFGGHKKHGIWEAYKGETEVCFDTPQEMLEHLIDGKRLGDILQDIEMTERTLY